MIQLLGTAVQIRRNAVDQQLSVRRGAIAGEPANRNLRVDDALVEPLEINAGCLVEQLERVIDVLVLQLGAVDEIDRPCQVLSAALTTRTNDHHRAHGRCFGADGTDRSSV